MHGVGGNHLTRLITATASNINEHSYGDHFCHNKVGYYKGNLVFIKRINKRSIDLTRTIRKELIQVTSLIINTIYNNLSPFFFFFIIMYNHVIILSHYVPKMREMRHENVNPFIGACIDPPYIAILTLFCARGSLEVFFPLFIAILFLHKYLVLKL